MQFRYDREISDSWNSICRYVLPLIGHAIEEKLIVPAQLLKLNSLEFHDNQYGGFQSGLSLFHYACKSAQLNFVEMFIVPKAIDRLITVNNNKCAAIG